MRHILHFDPRMLHSEGKQNKTKMRRKNGSLRKTRGNGRREEKIESSSSVQFSSELTHGEMSNNGNTNCNRL